MNIALVVAGGVGARTNNYIPKQFLTIYDKPIIVYTMQNLMKANCFDKIFVAVNDRWSDFVDSYAKQFEIASFGGGSLRAEQDLNRYLTDLNIWRKMDSRKVRLRSSMRTGR